MNARSTPGPWRARLPALIAALAVLAPATAGGQGSPVVWQGTTPDSGTAYAAGVGRDLRIGFEAVGSFGSAVRIRVNQLPPGARLVRLAEAPARVDFRWRPRPSQRGEWRFVFSAVDGASAAPRIIVRVHVGKTASRSFRLSSRTLGGSSHNAVLRYAVAARAAPNESARVLARLKPLTPEHVPHVLLLSAGRFYVRERLTGFTDPIYGSLAFGTNGRSAVLTDWPGGGFIGIHGTNQPEILPGRVSHGCVRLPNRAIRRLDRLMPVGTPVTIR